VPDLAETYVEQAARISTEHWSGPPEMVERIARLTGTRRGQVVVDLGCGIGGPARRLARLFGCRVIGIDVLEDLVRIAARRRRASRVSFVAGAAPALPIRSRSADQVWALGSTAHVLDRGAMAAEVTRVLRPGGTLAVTEAFWDGRGVPRFAATAPKPWSPTTVTGLMSALAAGGLVDIRALPWPGWEIAGVSEPEDAALARDIRDGVLLPHLVLARCP